MLYLNYYVIDLRLLVDLFTLNRTFIKYNMEMFYYIWENILTLEALFYMCIYRLLQPIQTSLDIDLLQTSPLISTKYMCILLTNYLRHS